MRIKISIYAFISTFCGLISTIIPWLTVIVKTNILNIKMELSLEPNSIYGFITFSRLSQVRTLMVSGSLIILIFLNKFEFESKERYRDSKTIPYIGLIGVILCIIGVFHYCRVLYEDSYELYEKYSDIIDLNVKINIGIVLAIISIVFSILGFLSTLDKIDKYEKLYIK